MQIFLQQFQGPLDLLLTLIQKQKLDISKISLSKVADQYLKFIDENKNIPFYKLLDFLTIASQLIILKTRVLLPYLLCEDQEEEDENNLVIKLQNYQTYLNLAKKLRNRLLDQNYQCISRSRSINFRIDEDSISPALMHKIAKQILKQKIQLPSITTFKQIFSIQEKIKQIHDYLKQKEKFLFSELTESMASKIEIVISFLAMLELNKNGYIAISQQKMFEEITILKLETYNL